MIPNPHEQWLHPESLDVTQRHRDTEENAQFLCVSGACVTLQQSLLQQRFMRIWYEDETPAPLTRPGSSYQRL